jgi:hypothetical protein
LKSFLNIELNWKNIFRIFLCVILLIDVICIFLPSHYKPFPSISKWEAHYIFSIIPYSYILQFIYFLIGIVVLFIIVSIVALIGLWKFWKSARELFIVAYLIDILGNIAFLRAVRYWWDLPLSIIYNIFCIAVIVFSYTSYTKLYFNKDKSFESVTEDTKIDNVNNVA